MKVVSQVPHLIGRMKEESRKKGEQNAVFGKGLKNNIAQEFLGVEFVSTPKNVWDF